MTRYADFVQYNSRTQIAEFKGKKVDYYCGASLGPIDRIVLDLHFEVITPLQAQVLLKSLLVEKLL